MKFWRLTWAENPWAPTKIKEKKPSKEIRELQRRFLAAEISYSEFTVKMNTLKNK